MTEPTIYFLRHGETDWNVERRLQGQQDIPINKNGYKQAKANGKALSKLLDDPKRFRYIASPLGRTRETMNLVRLELGLPSHGYETDDRLKEIAFGMWETRTYKELEVNHKDQVEQRRADKWNYQPPQGESYQRLYDRVKSWLPYVTEDSVVVCHGGILRVLDHHYNNIPQKEASRLHIPQDKIFKVVGKHAAWL